MVIDFHVHIQPRSGEEDVQRFLDAMEENGIDRAVVHALGRTTAELEGTTANISRLVEKHPDKLIGFGSVFPTNRDAAAQLESQVMDMGMKGLKLHPLLQQFSPADTVMAPLMEKCRQLKIPVLFHTGPGYMRDGRLADADAVLIDELAKRYPEVSIIIAHGDPLGPDPYIAARNENVYLDTTIRFAQIARLMPNIGEEMLDWMKTDERLLYGSDAFPEHMGYFSYNLEPIRKMNISEESRAKILGGNAARLLGLA